MLGARLRSLRAARCFRPYIAQSLISSMATTDIPPLPPLPPPPPPSMPFPTPSTSVPSHGGGSDTNNSSTESSSRISPPPKDTRPLGRIPIRHSRKRLPTIITDVTQLEDLSLQILEAPIGSLYTFDTDRPHAQEDPWVLADPNVQAVEAILRGLAWRVPETCWHRWAKTRPVDGDRSVDPAEVAISMQDIINRLYEEGWAYMKVRADRLEEIDASAAEARNDGVVLLDDDQPDAEKKELGDQQKNNLLPEATAPSEEDEEREIIQQKYLHDFAAPGPTIAMIDTTLDVLACGAPEMTAEQACRAMEDADFLLGLAHARYQLDGGDAKHENVHTRLTALSFNALIRLASQVKYKEGQERVRDEAITLAFSTFQAMDECAAVYRNSASYTYLLRTISKFMPASRIRGNIARGMFEQARYRCLVNDNVIAAYKQANEPSNCEMDDKYIKEVLESPDGMPVKWRRESKLRRHHVREDTY